MSPLALINTWKQLQDWSLSSGMHTYDTHLDLIQNKGLTSAAMDKDTLPLEDNYRDIHYWLSRTSNTDEICDKLKPYSEHQALLRNSIIRITELRKTDDTGSAQHFFEQCKQLEAKTRGLHSELRKSLDSAEGLEMDIGKKLLLGIQLVLSAGRKEYKPTEEWEELCRAEASKAE
ncbi:MAG: hypothetical protein Q9183_005564 [Haloplaca sp. 2 TL-2023]